VGALSHSHGEVLPTHMRRADMLGIGLPFRTLDKTYSVPRERPGTSSTNWRCASRPGFSEPRTHSTSTTARRGRVRGGGGFRATHQAVRARWSFFDYSQESRSPRARDRQTAAPRNYYLLAQSVKTEFDPTRIPQEWTARRILGELIWRRAQNSQITTAPISKFGRASLCPGESASTVAPSKPARLAHCLNGC
jgi:hypothetical protein